MYATCPASTTSDFTRYQEHIGAVAQWCDTAGIKGALVYTDNSIADPWLVAQLAITASRSFVPLVAVQPFYQHPFTVARAVGSLALLHNRRVDLNFVSGGFRGDLASLGDDVDANGRYPRVVEYVDVVRRLLTGERVTFDGQYFRLASARLPVVPPADLMPDLFLSGSSPGSIAAADQLGLGRLMYPGPPNSFEPSPSGVGIRIGIIARDLAAAAWEVAEQRFPPDASGVATQRIVSRMSGSYWQRELSARADTMGDEQRTYWLRPFHSYRTFCPYLVGSYDDVAAELRQYARAGVHTIILDVPSAPDDLAHARAVLARLGESGPSAERDEHDDR